MGHYVVGVDVSEIDGVRERTDEFFKADLNDGIPSAVGEGFDIVLAADVLEHVVNPGNLLSQVREFWPPGTALYCVPNIAHWYPRFRSALGMFDYDQRGILDSTHLRFFTRRSIVKLVEHEGIRHHAHRARRASPRCTRGREHPGPLDSSADRVLSDLWPTMFGYQFIIESTPVRN